MTLTRRVKLAVLTSADVTKLNGCIQSLTDTEAKYRPKATAVQYIAAQLGVSERTAKEWVRRARPMSRRTTMTHEFFELYETIANLLVESLEGAVWQTAMTAGGRDAMKAAMYLLPRVNEERYGDNVEEPDSDDVLNIADEPQETFDAMTPAQLMELESQQQRVVDAREKTATLILQARQKAMADKILTEQVH